MRKEIYGEKISKKPVSLMDMAVIGARDAKRKGLLNKIAVIHIAKAIKDITCIICGIISNIISFFSSSKIPAFVIFLISLVVAVIAFLIFEGIYMFG